MFIRDSDDPSREQTPRTQDYLQTLATQMSHPRPAQHHTNITVIQDLTKIPELSNREYKTLAYQRSYFMRGQSDEKLSLVFFCNGDASTLAIRLVGAFRKAPTRLERRSWFW